MAKVASLEFSISFNVSWDQESNKQAGRYKTMLLNRDVGLMGMSSFPKDHLGLEPSILKVGRFIPERPQVTMLHFASSESITKHIS